MIYPEELNEQAMGILTLNVTDACNCCCRYCFTQPNPSIMSLKTGIDAVNWFVKYNAEKDIQQKVKLIISFFGGEPTLRWDEFVVPIIEYIEDFIAPQYSDRFDICFACTTNAQLLNEERIKWFIEHKGDFLLSMDGDRESQEYNRPRCDGKSSFDPADKNIDILLKYQPELTFRSTVTPGTAKNLSHDYLFARSRGFRNWFAMPNVREQWSKDDLQTLQEEMTLVCGIMLRDIENDIPPVEFNYIPGALKAIACPEPINTGYMRCGLGTTSIAVATDGSLYGCQENSTYHDENNPFYIGDIYNGINKERHLALIQFFNNNPIGLTNEKCEDCILKDGCGTWICPSSNFAVTGDLLKRPEPMCEWLKIIYYAAQNIILNAAEINSEKFIKWLAKEVEDNG